MHMSVRDSRFHANLAVPNSVVILTLPLQTMSVISVLFIALFFSFFYYTVTGGWGIIEVRE